MIMRGTAAIAAQEERGFPWMKQTGRSIRVSVVNIRIYFFVDLINYLLFIINYFMNKCTDLTVTAYGYTC